MNLHTGTSGFAYKEWKGSFYPEDLSAAKMLSYYGSKLDAVEINNTFYRLPKVETLTKWAADVPEGFSFVLKASRRITHFTRLKPEAADPLDYLIRTATEGLGARLGPILFQLPPNLKKDLDRLQNFLPLLPKDIKAAFEFRNDTWFSDDVYDALRAHNAALVVADTEDRECPVEVTASFGYARLRRPGYTETEIAAWAKRLSDQPWSDLWVFFKHEDEGAGPAMAQDFRSCWPG